MQRAIFQYINQHHNPQPSLEHLLVKLLSIDLMFAFRLVRDQEVLTADQLFILAEYFGFSLDSLLGNKLSAIPFRFNALNYNIHSLNDFFATILKDLRDIGESEHRKMFYAANDFPLFSLFQFPELAAFKLFFWGRTVYDLSSYRNRKFALEAIDLQVLQVGIRAWQQYLKMPSIEIWSADIVNNVLKQIYHYWQNQLFVYKSDALEICDTLLEFLDHMESQAALRKKFHPFKKKPNQENYQLFFNEVSLTGNTILIESQKTNKTFILQNTLNYLVTNDSIFCMQTTAWMHRLIEHSQDLSGIINTPKRVSFFNTLKENVIFVKLKIQEK